MLDVELFSQDLGKTITVRNYLKELLLRLWDEGEGFSRKRPFGNSGWEFDLYAGLIREGFIEGTVEDDFVEDYNKKQAHAVVRNCILECFENVPT